MKRLAILGSTGSIGTQTLDVVRALAGEFEIVGLSSWRNTALLAQQIREWHPRAVAVRDDEAARELLGLLGMAARPEILIGPAGLTALAQVPCDQVVVAVVGAAGIEPTLAAVRNGRNVAFANKETLVAAGHIVMSEAVRCGSTLVPVDSEHSAIWQCLMGQAPGALKRILVTASGGPFRGRAWSELRDVTPAQALRHPNWAMGGKITVDSATLMNKGLEVIEAHWLFGADFDQIDVVVHPQSIIHSLVELTDGSVLAQLGWPDMRLPIQLALTYPERLPSGLEPLSLGKVGNLSFEEIGEEQFPCLRLAIQAGVSGGTHPCVMNAANEVAVHAFLRGQARFTAIAEIVERVMNEYQDNGSGDLQAILDADTWAREEAERWVTRLC